MHGAAGALALVVTALLVCCRADPRQESEVNGNQHTGDRFDNGGDLKQKANHDNYLRFLLTYRNNVENIGDLPFPGVFPNLREKSITEFGTSASGRNYGPKITNLLLGRNYKESDGAFNAGAARNLNDYDVLGRDVDSERYSRFVDSLGGGNFVRNLDSIGGGVMVKKNLDHIGGPNLVKRIVDSLGGGNLVRRSNFIRYIRGLDSIGGGQKGSLDHLGAGLVRQARESGPYGFVPYLMTRRFDFGSRFGGKREQWPGYSGYYAEGLPKRNFDEIDRSDMDSFVKKRNFDEIDQSSMPFPYKRFYQLYGHNNIDINSAVSSIDKKRYRADYPMDEIDLSQFPMGSKRSQDGFRTQH